MDTRTIIELKGPAALNHARTIYNITRELKDRKLRFEIEVADACNEVSKIVVDEAQTTVQASNLDFGTWLKSGGISFLINEITTRQNAILRAGEATFVTVLSALQDEAVEAWDALCTQAGLDEEQQADWSLATMLLDKGLVYMVYDGATADQSEFLRAALAALTDDDEDEPTQ